VVAAAVVVAAALGVVELAQTGCDLDAPLLDQHVEGQVFQAD
jgi:hypothetical protein